MASRDTVASIMSKPVRTVDSSQSLKATLGTMLKHDIGSVVVTKSGKP